ncbi:hypothetical protein [Candidatus Deianiraea vastatrix]|uniref:Uncharacterized protein n=1 Tax=Candidatus Deianiraea vastatrix TaxID=2163644 RepID=A0A5B8XBX9_9RICK|nr:hypothetical protein [Candidatus Deianiraea vastatrix]QED22848.1 hypothetical protein Deia_00034 [Candidatus Deianiraea vastatrix]
MKQQDFKNIEQGTKKAFNDLSKSKDVQKLKNEVQKRFGKNKTTITDEWAMESIVNVARGAAAIDKQYCSIWKRLWTSNVSDNNSNIISGCINGIILSGGRGSSLIYGREGLDNKSFAPGSINLDIVRNHLSSPRNHEFSVGLLGFMNATEAQRQQILTQLSSELREKVSLICEIYSNDRYRLAVQEMINAMYNDVDLKPYIINVLSNPDCLQRLLELSGYLDTQKQGQQQFSQDLNQTASFGGQSAINNRDIEIVLSYCHPNDSETVFEKILKHLSQFHQDDVIAVINQNFNNPTLFEKLIGSDVLYTLDIKSNDECDIYEFFRSIMYKVAGMMYGEQVLNQQPQFQSMSSIYLGNKRQDVTINELKGIVLPEEYQGIQLDDLARLINAYEKDKNEESVSLLMNNVTSDKGLKFLDDVCIDYDKALKDLVDCIYAHLGKNLKIQKDSQVVSQIPSNIYQQQSNVYMPQSMVKSVITFEGLEASFWENARQYLMQNKLAANKPNIIMQFVMKMTNDEAKDVLKKFNKGADIILQNDNTCTDELCNRLCQVLAYEAILSKVQSKVNSQQGSHLSQFSKGSSNLQSLKK